MPWGQAGVAPSEPYSGLRLPGPAAAVVPGLFGWRGSGVGFVWLLGVSETVAAGPRARLPCVEGLGLDAHILPL